MAALINQHSRLKISELEGMANVNRNTFKYGFIVWHNEWWHFDIQDWQNNPVLDFVPTK